MSLEPNQPAGGEKRPAFTGRFPILAAETPPDQGPGERRPALTAPASGPAEAVTPAAAPAAEGGQAADPAPAGDGGTGSGSGSGGSEETLAKDGSVAGNSEAGAADADSGETASASGPTAALRPGIRSATSGATGATVIAPAAKTGGGAGTPIAPGSADADRPARADGASGGPAGSAQSMPTAVDVADLDGPLLGDTVALRSNWEQLQSGFVDDPREAVADAAELVEQTVQALIAALRQRQRTLRELGKPGAKGAGSATDTEHLRRMMLRYRSLFNQLCRP